MARQQTAGNLTKKTLRVPLAGNGQQRDTEQYKDQRFVNYVFETTKNSVTETKKLFLVKRPGTVEYLNPAAGAAEGRGCWYYNGAVWSIFGSKLYKNTTEMATLTTSTGQCGATTFVNNEDYGNQGLFIADGTDAWIVDTTDTVTQVDTIYLQWAARTTVEVGDRRVPTTLGALWYVCIQSGTTGATAPTWPGTLGLTVTDGTAIWRCEGTYSGPVKYTTGAKSLGDRCIPTAESGYWYEVITAGTGTAQPTWPLEIGNTVTDNTVVWECKGQYGGFPTPHVPTPVFMDGYIFLPDSGSLDIYNSDVSTPASWGALAFASAESFPDPVIGLSRQNNYIAALGTGSVEFMYNYAKSSQITDFDSPLDRYESLVLQTGCLTKDALLSAERTLVFIGVSPLSGKTVWRLDGTNAKEISTEYIEKFIDLETSTSGITGWSMRILGHMLFVINLPTANKTFVYDIEENMWSEWKYGAGGDAIPFMHFCDANGVPVVQHATNGKLYKFDPLVYNDFGSAAIECSVVLSKQDFEVDDYKFFHKFVLIGDRGTGIDYLRWSDDDYQTWSNSKALTAGLRPYFLRSGKARRRAWEISYSDNSARRLEAVEITYSVGDH